MVEERFARMEESEGNWDDKPVRRSVTSLDARVIINAVKQNDLLMWLMSDAKGVERSLEGFARRMLVINFAAIFTTSLVSHINLLMCH
jgi:hypothetical protein